MEAALRNMRQRAGYSSPDDVRAQGEAIGRAERKAEGLADAARRLVASGMTVEQGVSSSPTSASSFGMESSMNAAKSGDQLFPLAAAQAISIRCASSTPIKAQAHAVRQFSIDRACPRRWIRA